MIFYNRGGTMSTSPPRQFWKSVRYVAFFYNYDKESGYKELVYTGIYECTDMGNGYAEFKPFSPIHRRQEKIFPEVICELGKDKNGDYFAFDTDYDSGYYNFTDIQLYATILGYNNIAGV